MRYTDNDIRQELLGAWDELTESQYPEDLLDEWAGSACPIYYNQMLADWAEMPSEFNDSWQEYGLPAEPTIFRLMEMDLITYYRDRYLTIWQEIKEEKEELEDA
jgi:hypothetical protein